MFKPFVIIFCFILADVIAKVTVADLIAKVYGRYYCHNSVVMLLPLVILRYVNIVLTGVIAKLYCGRSYCHIVVVDVVTTFCCY